MDGHHCPTRASSSSSSSSDSASTSSSAAAATIGQQQPQCSISTVFPAAEVTCFPSTAEAIEQHPATANASMRPQRRRKEDQIERGNEQQSLTTSPVTATSSQPRSAATVEQNLHLRKETKTAAAVPSSSSSKSPRPHPFPHPTAQQRVADHIIVVPPADQQIGHQAHQAEQPQHLTTPAEASKKRHSAQSGSHKSGDEGMLVLLQQKLFEHYHTVAYALVIVSYFLAFCEYLYLRLVSLIFPEPIIYRRQCAKHPGEAIYRNELHFASGMVVFLVMSIFQLVCFFLLTVSSKYLEVRRTFSHVLSIEERLHHEAVFAVKRTMFATLYPTFAIYALCSSTIFCSIFYMVGLRDPIVHVGSRVIVHLFDVCVVAYFVAFPALCVLFHPEINVRSKLLRFCCTKKLGGRRRAAVNSMSPSLQTTDGPAKGVINGIGSDAAIATAGGAIRRPGAGVVHPPTLQHPQQQQPSMTVTTMPGTVVQHGADAVNYGSIAVERRRPSRQQQSANNNIQQIVANNEMNAESNAEGSMTQSEAAKVRERMRQRRQSRYKRLRGGSDESADCFNEGRRPVVESMEAKIWRNEQEEIAGRAEEENDEDRHKKWEEEEESEKEEGRHGGSTSEEDEEEEGEEEELEEEEAEPNLVQRREEAGTKFHGLELRLDLQDGFGPVTC